MYANNYCGVPAPWSDSIEPTYSHRYSRDPGLPYSFEFHPILLKAVSELLISIESNKENHVGPMEVTRGTTAMSGGTVTRPKCVKPEGTHASPGFLTDCQLDRAFDSVS